MSALAPAHTAGPVLRDGSGMSTNAGFGVRSVTLTSS